MTQELLEDLYHQLATDSDLEHVTGHQKYEALIERVRDYLVSVGSPQVAGRTFDSMQAAPVESGQDDGLVSMIDCGTCVLTQSDLVLLSELSRQDKRTGFPRVVEHEYGFCIFLSGDDEFLADELAATEQYGFSPAMGALLTHGHKNGAYILNLDQDGDAIIGLPYTAE